MSIILDQISFYGILLPAYAVYSYVISLITGLPSNK